MKISNFEWDEGNLEKLIKHNVPMAHVEDFFAQSQFHIITDAKHSFQEPRFIALGKYNERNFTVVFTLRANTGVLKIRVISARYAHNKEMRKLYEEIKSSKKS